MRSRIKRGVGQSGGDDFEAYPGREEFAAGEEGAARWPEQMLAHADFSDAGIEVRSMDYRHRKVGLFGDFLSRRWQLRWLRRLAWQHRFMRHTTRKGCCRCCPTLADPARGKQKFHVP